MSNRAKAYSRRLAAESCHTGDRGKHLAALGHGHVTDGATRITMRDRRRITRGKWTVTLVLARAHKAPATSVLQLRIK